MQQNGTKDMERQTRILRNRIVTISDIEDFKTTLLQEIKILLQETNRHPVKQSLKSSEVMEMLNIYPGTLQSIQVNGTRAYAKVGGIVFYRHDDISRLSNNQTSKTIG